MTDVRRYLYCFCICALTFAQTNRDTILNGCLSGLPPNFSLSLKGGQTYTLTGNTSTLIKWSDKEVSVLGRADMSTQPWPTFRVIRLEQGFETPKPRLNPSISNLSAWGAEINQTYGIRFALPDEFSGTKRSAYILRPNFAANDNVATASRFEISPDVFPHSNFGGGMFVLFVSPEIKNAQSCREFGNPETRFRSTYRSGNIEYAAYNIRGGAMGTVYVGYDFHTFQNGLCYEVAFQFRETETGNYDLGCMTPAMSEADEMRLIRLVLARISFIPPALATTRESNASAIPSVTRFEASSDVAAFLTNRGTISFSWSTQNADYVELSFRCDPAPIKLGLVVLDDRGPLQCENAKPEIYHHASRNFAPNGSHSIVLGSFLPDPISVTVTLIPFARGTAYPDSSKFVTIRVEPRGH